MRWQSTSTDHVLFSSTASTAERVSRCSAYRRIPDISRQHPTETNAETSGFSLDRSVVTS